MIRRRSEPEKTCRAEVASCMGIHPTAIVAKDAVVGDDVEVGPFCVVGSRVRLGDRCLLHAHVVVDGATELGDECELYPGVVLGSKPQDKKIVEREAPGRLVLGRGNILREHVTIHGGTPFGTGITRVGDNNMFLAGAHVGHDAVIGSNVVFTNGAMAAGHSRVEDKAILGAMVGIHQFARVGTLAMVGAGAMVSRDAPPFALIQGDRARLVGVNLIGIKRSGFAPEQSTLVKRLFRLLFWRDGSLAQRIENARATLPRDPIVERVLGFVAESRRGICMPRGRIDVGDEREVAE
jgi:UDP-N-acetylglucosamine acyltransferase